MEERRELERRPAMESISYSVTVLDFKDLRRLHLRGDVVDISDAGMGMKTDYPLEPGHVLTFDNGMKHSAGIVEWSTMDKNNGYRVGIKFI